MYKVFICEKLNLQILVQGPKICQKNIFTYISQCKMGVQVYKYLNNNYPTRSRSTLLKSTTGCYKSTS